MSFRNEWERPEDRHGWGFGGAGMGALRITLLFGSAAVALALILVPVAENQAEKMMYSSYPGGLDMMATGTIGGAVGQRGGSAYVVRRSVLQPSPSSVCIIRQNGMRTGDC